MKIRMTSMAKRTKHSKAEIAAKLAQADDLETQGKLQSEIARALGVSVMTLHRWRKTPTKPHAAQPGLNGSSRADHGSRTRVAELQLENSRLRRLVIDLLLEKMKLEENLASGTQTAPSLNFPRGPNNAKGLVG
jgi:putative transposase